MAAVGTAPRWLYYFNGFSVFWYLHLDCLDGKQARRTKSSSPLGQLFDHGMPAWSHFRKTHARVEQKGGWGRGALGRVVGGVLGSVC